MRWRMLGQRVKEQEDAPALDYILVDRIARRLAQRVGMDDHQRVDAFVRNVREVDRHRRKVEIFVERLEA